MMMIIIIEFGIVLLLIQYSVVVLTFNPTRVWLFEWNPFFYIEQFVYCMQF